MSLVGFERRRLLIGVGAALVVPPFSASAADLVVTPGQTEGPYFPASLPADMDADLVRVKGQAAQAMGQVTHISGRVLDKHGQAVRGALVEIWQCDARGIYNHPGDPGLKRRDAAFQAAGRYAFRTIRPVAYVGRTPHIHFKVHAPGVGRLTTQMYVAGEPQNTRDGVLNGIRDRQARESVIVRLEAADAVEPGAHAGTFDIVLAI
jgi:protocatechuate 3,4-dioxygenase beta subunit